MIALTPDEPPRQFRWRGRVHRIRLAEGPERIGAVAELLDVELLLEVVSKQRRKVRVVGKTPRGADLIRALAG